MNTIRAKLRNVIPDVIPDVLYIVISVGSSTLSALYIVIPVSVSGLDTIFNPLHMQVHMLCLPFSISPSRTSSYSNRRKLQLKVLWWSWVSSTLAWYVHHLLCVCACILQSKVDRCTIMALQFMFISRITVWTGRVPLSCAQNNSTGEEGYQKPFTPDPEHYVLLTWSLNWT